MKTVLTSLAGLASAMMIGYLSILTVNAINYRSYEANVISTVKIEGVKMIGAGFAVAPGVVLTAGHVATTKDAIVMVTDSDGKTMTGKTIVVDEKNDLGLIAVDPAKTPPTVNVQCDIPELASTSYTIGMGQGYEWIAFFGRLTADHMILRPEYKGLFPEIYDKTLSFNMRALKGNSGGGIYSLETGAVISVTTMIALDPQEQMVGLTFGPHSEVVCDFLKLNGVPFSEVM